MIRSAASKVMWVGRATVFLVGLAVILALVFGAVSTVSAHTGDRGFFHLGHKNVSGAVSKLVGKVAGPSLFIGNGSEDRRATALRLNVKPGKAPMKVNAAAGTARNLSADKLDGVNSSGFYRSGSKVADSDKLDGKDSTQIGVNGVETVLASSQSNSNSPKIATASCPSGKVLVGTGYDIDGAKSGFVSEEQTDVVVDEVRPSPNLVTVRAYEEEATNANWSVRAYAICAKAP